MHIFLPNHKYSQKQEARNMKKWKAVRVRQELVDQVAEEVQKSGYDSLSDFVSDAIRNRLQTLAKQRVSKYLERDKTIRTPLIQNEVYTPRHVWARETSGGNIAIGITKYFQYKLKDIVNIRTDAVGKHVRKDEPFGVLESWWFTYDLYSPLSGKIVGINTEVMENPFILNADPSMWVVEIQPESTESTSWINDTLQLDEYKELIRKPVTRTVNEPLVGT
jgi:glycine cleavage system H protein